MFTGPSLSIKRFDCTETRMVYARILLFKTISILTVLQLAVSREFSILSVNCSGLIVFIYCHIHMCVMNVSLLLTHSLTLGHMHKTELNACVCLYYVMCNAHICMTFSVFYSLFGLFFLKRGGYPLHMYLASLEKHTIYAI